MMAKMGYIKNANDNSFFHFIISILWKKYYLCYYHRIYMAKEIIDTLS